MRLLLCLPVLLISAACSRPAAEPASAEKDAVRKYALHGEILRLDAQDHLATIKHEKIGDWMGAMTMEFPVKDPRDFAKLREGDKVDGTVFVQDLNYWLGDVSVKRDPAGK